MILSLFKLSFHQRQFCLLKPYANRQEANRFETESTVLYPLLRRLTIDSTVDLDSSNVAAPKPIFDIP